VVNSSQFDYIISAVILINAVVMGLELEYQGTHSADKLGIKRDEGPWSNAAEVFFVLEHIFGMIYLSELILRLAVVGFDYFKHTLNLIDFVAILRHLGTVSDRSADSLKEVVLAACLELYVFPHLKTDVPDITMIRLMRCVRVVRILRILRTVRSFHQLRTLVSAVIHSVWSLIWSLALLGIAQVICSVFMTQTLQTFLQDGSKDPVVRAEVYTYFGSWSRSFITMFEMSIWGSTWGRCGRIVIFSVSRFYAFFFIGHLAFVSFAMIRVIGALFLKDTLTSAGKCAEEAMQEENRDPAYVHQIWKLFNQLDQNGGGALDLHELSLLLEDEAICDGFRKVGVLPQEVPALFTLMDDGDDEVNFCEFLSGIMRLKNANKGVDLATVLYENKKMLKRVLRIGAQVDELVCKKRI